MTQATIGFAGDHEQDTKARGRRLSSASSPRSSQPAGRIVTFKPLTPEVMETIVDKFVMELEVQLRERKVAIDLKPEARRISREGLRSGLRARPLNRLSRPRCATADDEILFGRLEHGGTVHVASTVRS